MSMIEESKATPVDDATQAGVRASWAALIATAVLTTSLMAVSGFLFGTVEGDIPWPATRTEETVYYTARGLEWGAAAVAFVGAIIVAVFPPWRARSGRWFWAAVTLVGSGILGIVVFFVAYTFAHENYLFALTS